MCLPSSLSAFVYFCVFLYFDIFIWFVINFSKTFSIFSADTLTCFILLTLLIMYVCASSMKLMNVLQTCYLSLFVCLLACCFCVHVHPVMMSTFVSSCFEWTVCGEQNILTVTCYVHLSNTFMQVTSYLNT